MVKLSSSIPTAPALALPIALCAGVAKPADAKWPEPESVTLAPGITQFITPDLGGNTAGSSIAIETEREVLLFDATLLPATAHAVLSKLAHFTPKPVKYLVNSHWHPDHSGGNETIASAFPGMEILASHITRELMDDTVSVYVKTLEFESAQAHKEIDASLKSGKSSEGKKLTPADVPSCGRNSRWTVNFLASSKR
jgi:cyclase